MGVSFKCIAFMWIEVMFLLWVLRLLDSNLVSCCILPSNMVVVIAQWIRHMLLVIYL